MMTWYNRQGKTIPVEVAEILLGDLDYKTVARTKIGKVWISTVWLGLDHRFPENSQKPLIFETMTFKDKKGKMDTSQPLDFMDRYSTIEEAKKGHSIICKRVKE